MNSATPQDGRTPYHTPVLRDHGTVAEITLAGSGEFDLEDSVTYGASAAGNGQTS